MYEFILNTGEFNQRMARFYFKQLMEAICMIHSIGASHRDIKFENVLLDENFNLKLTDFGFSTIRPVSTTIGGTTGYMAPEIFEGKEYNGQKADIFAAGVLAFIMLTA